MERKTEKLTFRFSKSFVEKMDELCDVYSMNKTALIERLVNGEYMKTTEKGKAQVQALLKEFENLGKSLEQFNK